MKNISKSNLIKYENLTNTNNSVGYKYLKMCETRLSEQDMNNWTNVYNFEMLSPLYCKVSLIYN